MQPGGEMWRKDALYEIMDGKSNSLVRMLEQDPDLKKWRCKQVGDECLGFTLLHGAVRFGNKTALKILLDNGAVFILAKDKMGKSPFDWGILESEPLMVDMMLKCASDGVTPMPNLDLALKNAEAQVTAAERMPHGMGKVKEAIEVRDLIQRYKDEQDRALREKEAADAAKAKEVLRLIEEEVVRSAARAAAAAEAAAERFAEQRRRRMEAVAQAKLDEEARLREEERRRKEEEEEQGGGAQRTRRSDADDPFQRIGGVVALTKGHWQGPSDYMSARAAAFAKRV